MPHTMLEAMKKTELARMAADLKVVDDWKEALVLGRDELAAGIIAKTPKDVLMEHLRRKQGAQRQGCESGIEQLQGLIGLLSESLLTPEQVFGLVQSETGDLEDRLLRAVRHAVAGMEPTLRKVELKFPDGSKRIVDKFVHEKFERVLKLSSIRQNILLVGPAGCGKTALAEQVAKAMDLPFAFVSCSAGMSENQLTGWLLPVQAGGAFAYVPASFVELYEQGGVFLIDEIDAADENVLLALNAALANGQMTIPQRRESPLAKKHKDFVCIAAANTFGHGGDLIYAGRNKLDGATLDRFRAGVVKMDYDANLEEALVDSEVLRWAMPIRQRIRELKLKRVMSTRALLDYTKQKEMLGFGPKDWEESFFADWTRDELVKIGRE